MLDVPMARRLWFGVFSVACAAEPNYVQQAEIWSPPGTQAQASASAPVQERWPRFEESLSWPLVSQATLSQHQLRQELVEVRVTALAVEAYLHLTRGSALPSGSGIALRLNNQELAESFYVMHKPTSEWRFLVLGNDGEILDDDASGFCARCHAEGVSDSLFGIVDSARGEASR